MSDETIANPVPDSLDQVVARLRSEGQSGPAILARFLARLAARRRERREMERLILTRVIDAIEETQPAGEASLLEGGPR